MSWYTTGEDNLDEDERQEKEENQSKGAKRFFLRENTEREIIFLSNDAVRIWEHNPLVNGEWKPDNWYTCRQGVFREDPTCAMCQAGISRYKMGFYTILDTTAFTYKGREYKNLRRLLALRLEGLKKIKIKKDRVGGLVGRRFLFARTSAKSPNVGNDWEPMGQEDTFRACPECRMELQDREGEGGVTEHFCGGCGYTGDGLFLLSDKQYWWKDREGGVHPPMPYDLKKILAPMSNDELRRALREGGRQTSQPESSKQTEMHDNNGPGADEEIPF